MSSSIAQTSALLVAGGLAGAALTAFLLSKRRRLQASQKDASQTNETRTIRPALQEAEDRRQLLPSTIILVRHGESVGNADSSQFSSMPDNLLPLTERGIDQAVAAGRRVESILSGRTSRSMLDIDSDESSVRNIYLNSSHSGRLGRSETGLQDSIRGSIRDSLRGVFLHTNHSEKLFESRSEIGIGNGTHTGTTSDSFHPLRAENRRVHFVLSPFERTLQTARAMRKAFEHRIVRTDIESRIREQEFGNVQHDDFRLQREEQKLIGRFWYRFATGESGADVYDRVKSWWFESVLNVNTRIGYEPIDAMVVVTHGLTMRFCLMQLFGWSPTTFHSVWNAGNCDLYVLRKDLSKPGNSPYILDRKAGDIPKSSIDLRVTFRSRESKNFTLDHYLSIPPPRTLRLEIVKKMLQDQYPEEVDAKEICTIEFMPFVAGEVIAGRTPSGAHGEQPSTSFNGNNNDLARQHQRQRSQNSFFSQMSREQSLNRCDSCFAPIPEHNWSENY